MNKQSLDERIDILTYALHEGCMLNRPCPLENQAKRVVYKMLRDVITEVTPEKRDMANMRGLGQIGNEGYNDAIDQVHTNLNKLLGDTR